MSALLRIRTEIFAATQAEMAAIAGVRQATWSRWEAGLAEPSRDDMKAIRDEAVRRALPWDDAWFFDNPSSAETVENAPCVGGSPTVADAGRA